MSGTARVQSSLQIVSGNVNYNPQPNAFNALVTLANGPTPGAILVATAPGTDVNLSALTAKTPSMTGGFCRIRNLDQTNYIKVGLYDTSDGEFRPFLELLPGEFYIFRLSRKLGKEYAGTGTGAGATSLRIVADTAACRVDVSAFDP